MDLCCFTIKEKKNRTFLSFLSLFSLMNSSNLVDQKISSKNKKKIYTRIIKILNYCNMFLN